MDLVKTPVHLNNLYSKLHKLLYFDVPHDLSCCRTFYFSSFSNLLTRTSQLFNSSQHSISLSPKFWFITDVPAATVSLSNGSNTVEVEEGGSYMEQILHN